MTTVLACSQLSLNLAWLPVHPGMKITDSSQFTQKILNSNPHVSANYICLSCLLHAYMYVLAYIIDILIWVHFCRRRDF